MPQLVDLMDHRLVSLLMENARMPNRALARQASISESNSYERVHRLVASGVIKGFHADADMAALGQPLSAVVSVKMRADKRDQLLNEAHRLSKLEGVLFVYFLAGPYDLMLLIAVESPTSMRDFIMRLNERETVASSETSVVMEALRGEHPVIEHKRLAGRPDEPTSSRKRHVAGRNVDG